jgi:hypothetical protein
MRAATIGEDGGIIDADGRSYNGKRAVGTIDRYRPMMENTPKRHRRSLLLGDDAIPNPSSTQQTVATQGVAYRQARRYATSLSGFTFVRKEGDPKSHVYPGMFVISDRFPDTLFRVAYRPSTDNNPAMTRLAVMEGKGAGSYIEVLIQSDGSGSPALLSDFQMVPIEYYLIVEYSIHPYPTPKVDDGQFWRTDFTWLYTAIDQAGFSLATLNGASQAGSWSANYNDILVQTSVALGIAADAIDMIGWAYDFGRIGIKELKILVRISGDIFSKSVDLFNDLLAFKGSTDEAKIEAFQKKADECSVMRAYWSIMLARASLYNQQNLAVSGFLANKIFNDVVSWSSTAYGMLSQNQAAMTKLIVAQGASPESAASQVAALISSYQLSRVSVQANYDTFKNQWVSSDLKDYSPGSLYTYSSFYGMMLKVNADRCLSIRSDIKSILLNSDMECIEGMGGSGQIPTILTPSLLSIMAAGFGNRKKLQDNLKNDILSQQKTLAKDLGTGDAAAIIRKKLSTLKNVAIQIIKDNPSIEMAPPIDVIQNPIMEAHRSVAGISETDRASRESGRNAIRIVDFAPETGLRKGLDQFVDFLNQADLGFSGIVKDADGRVVPPSDWSKPGNEWCLPAFKKMREDAGELVAKAFTEAFTVIENRPKGENDYEEIVTNIMARGLMDDPKLQDTILMNIFESAVESDLFSDGTIVGIGDALTTHLGVDEDAFSSKLQARIDKLNDEISNTRTTRVRDIGGGRTEEYSFTFDPSEKKRKEAERDLYETLLGVFAIKGSPERMVSNYSRAIVSYDDVIKAAKGRGETAPVTQEQVDTAKGIQAIAESTVKRANDIYSTISGQNSKLDYVVVMSLDKNKGLGSTLKSAIDALTGYVATLKLYTTLEAQAKIQTGEISMEIVRNAMENVRKATLEVTSAQQAVESALQEMTLNRVRIKVAGMVKAYFKFSIDTVTELGKKGAVGAGIALILVGPLLVGPFWIAAGLAWYILPESVRDYNPITWVANGFKWIFGLLPSPKIGDKAGEGGASSGGMGGLFWTALAIAMVFYGGKLFPAITEVMRTFTSGFKTVVSLAPWVGKKGKGKRGRPAGGGDDSDRKLKGRGAPIDLEQAANDLEKARAEGNVQAESRIKKKIERARERGQSVPPGLIGFSFWR